MPALAVVAASTTIGALAAATWTQRPAVPVAIRVSPDVPQATVTPSAVSTRPSKHRHHPRPRATVTATETEIVSPPTPRTIVVLTPSRPVVETTPAKSDDGRGDDGGGSDDHGNDDGNGHGDN